MQVLFNPLDEPPGETVMTSTETVATPKAQILDVETARTLYLEFGKRQPDFTLVRRFYHPDVRFKDAISDIQGFDAFEEMFSSFAERYVEMAIEVHKVMRDEDTMFLHWTMTVRPNKRFPRIPVGGMTRWDLDADDRVVMHRDFYDIWGDTLRAVPGVRGLYNRLMAKFG